MTDDEPFVNNEDTEPEAFSIMSAVVDDVSEQEQPTTNDQSKSNQSHADETLGDAQVRNQVKVAMPVEDSKAQIWLGSTEGRSHAKWLSKQLEGYTGWYFKSGVLYVILGSVLQVLAICTGLGATIMAAAPAPTIGHVDEWKWHIAILSAITTVLAGASPSLFKLARDRENGRVEMTRLRQELDILKDTPTLNVYLAAKAVIDRIAAIERGYGGVGSGK